METTRKHLTGAEKVAVLRRHLIDKQAVSDICEEVGLQSSQFYGWLKQFFENGAQALERTGGHDAAMRSHDTRRVEKLEAKLREKNDVIAELLAEHVALKKLLWRTEVARSYGPACASESLPRRGRRVAQSNCTI